MYSSPSGPRYVLTKMYSTVDHPGDNAGPGFAMLPKSYDADRYWKDDLLAVEEQLEVLTSQLGTGDDLEASQFELEIFQDSKAALLLLINEVRSKA